MSVAGEVDGAPVRPDVAHRQRGGINALIRWVSEEETLLLRFWRCCRLLWSLFADAAFTDGQVRVFIRVATQVCGSQTTRTRTGVDPGL